MSMVYDIDVVSLDDPYIHTAEEAGDSISETTIAGAFLVDIIPFRESSGCQTSALQVVSTDVHSCSVKYVPKWFPGAGFKKKASYWRVSVERLRDAPFDASLKRLVGLLILLSELWLSTTRRPMN